ncbi:MAG: 16S rRNA (guanine(966)-N(2))-methyltransferase RsmD [Chromatiales bacterium]|nr:MAG: 16S rRNA (guanine(966)-N(2))-methyltransferase RsmD [Chromatiales bacterium]
MAARSRRTARAGSVRIIGGRWRGRRLAVADATSTRPTPDRVRETLFNWLAPVLPGARCLDLYAGTGALGVEALSRGASNVVFVERNATVARQIETSLDMLGAEGGHVVTADVEAFLNGTPVASDVVFLDPPYGTVLDNLCTLLEQGWLAPRARIYLEWNRKQAPPSLPPSWQLLRDKAAGQVQFGLAERG